MSGGTQQTVMISRTAGYFLACIAVGLGLYIPEIIGQLTAGYIFVSEI
jgi:hypothetical protein